MSKSKKQPPREPTILETPEEIQRALVGSLTPTPPAAVPEVPHDPITPPEPVVALTRESQLQPFRPTVRPPLALLCICDDGRLEGEVVRLRGDRFVIGRTEGDVVIPFDAQISATHAEIQLHFVEGAYRWVLLDASSSNGTFVRISRFTLKDGSEFLVGSGRYRFDDVKPVPGQAEINLSQTQSWPAAAAGVPSLVELLADGVAGHRLPLTQTEYSIGRDAKCAVARPEDPVTSALHAKLTRHSSGRWVVKNESLNGVWLRVEQFWIEKNCHFQLGEQRFLMRVL